MKRPSSDGRSTVARQPRTPRGLFAGARDCVMWRLIFVVATFALLAYGLVMMFSVSAFYSVSEGGSWMDKSLAQLQYSAVGLVICLVAQRVNYRIFLESDALRMGCWAASMAALVLCYFFPEQNEAHRWISLGVNIQASEFAKVFIMLSFIAIMLRWYEGRISWQQALAQGGVCLGVPTVLIVLEPDLGTTLIMLSGAVYIMFMTRVPGKFWLAIFAAMVVFVALAVVGSTYRLQRFAGVFYLFGVDITELIPSIDSSLSDLLYQNIQGFYALGTGGWLGTGLGFSHQKYVNLPEGYNDFVFTLVGEEVGFVGLMVMLVLFAAFIYSGLMVARHASDHFGNLLAGCMVGMLGVQVCVNIMCCLCMLPLTGKPLPFFSYGGSSITSTLLMVGVVLSVSRFTQAEARYERKFDNLTHFSGAKAPAGKASSAKTPTAGKLPARKSVKRDAPQVAAPQSQTSKPRATRSSVYSVKRK